MKSSFDTEVHIEVDVEFDYSKGSRNTFSNSFGNWLPGDPPEASKIKCFALVTVHALKEALKEAERLKIQDSSRLVPIDIFSSLDDHRRALIEDECYAQAALDEQ